MNRKKITFLLRVIFFQLLALISFSCSTTDDIEELPTPVEQPNIQTFTVMTFNITGNKWSSNKDVINSIILNHQVDILGTQELSGNIKSEFMQLLGENYSIVETFDDLNVNLSPIIYNNQRFNLLDFGYKETPICGPRRFVNWALFKNLDNDQTFFFYNNHLCRGEEESQKQHGVDLIELMTEHQNKETNYRGIVTGDFNASEGTDLVDFILGKKSLTLNNTEYLNNLSIEDTWQLVNPNQNKPSQGNVAIDWIFCTSNWRVENSLVDTSNSESGGTPPSDHYPLITIFSNDL
ncbi:endonuclease/exonuclease/phosphatase family protein [Xanthovirga aplysinae]|uniref:endonuclease/exonuclease/phosphatase family protein n=1 Tax=Xanthovirga aplysinae TaxID=2529853 RepID=UPI001656DF79|nr:endonuclease/exonuclease/phosphatase family protein [Xanthovirga aplysinae]